MVGESRPARRPAAEFRHSTRRQSLPAVPAAEPRRREVPRSGRDEVKIAQGFNPGSRGGFDPSAGGTVEGQSYGIS
jgi:hypothetical protein